MVGLLFVLGGLTLGFSLLFFLVPQHISKRNILNISLGAKSKDSNVEKLINRVISIDEKISVVGVSVGLFLLILTLIILWMAYSSAK